MSASARTLLDVVRVVDALSREMLVRAGEDLLRPTFFMEIDGGLLSLVMPQWLSSDGEIALLRALAQKTGSTCAVFASLGWMSRQKGMAPSQAADREECLVLTACERATGLAGMRNVPLTQGPGGYQFGASEDLGLSDPANKALGRMTRWYEPLDLGPTPEAIVKSFWRQVDETVSSIEQVRRGLTSAPANIRLH